MSGSPHLVDLVTPPGGALRQMIAALGRIVEMIGDSSLCLVGGLAVMARLGERHRATTDIDAVIRSGERHESPRAVLVRRGATEVEGGLEVDRIKVDTIEVGRLDESGLPDDVLDRSFVLAHRWAIDSATPIELCATSPRGDLLERTVVPTATTAALLAMKLHSFPTRRAPERERKQASDLLDIYRLLVMSDVGSLKRTFATSPFDLASASAVLLDRMIEERAGETRKVLAIAGTTLPDVSFADFVSVAATLRTALA